MGLRELAAETDSNHESSLDFAARFARRNTAADRSGEVVTPPQAADPPSSPERPAAG
jgi:hypothetical protein